MQKFAATLLVLSLSVQNGAVLADPDYVTNSLRGVSGVSSPQTNYAAVHQRRELGWSSWWSSLMNALHCGPIGPKHHCHHPEQHHSGGGGGGGSSSSSSSGGGGGGGHWDDDGHSHWSDDGHDESVEWSDDGHSSNGWSNDGYGKGKTGDETSSGAWSSDGWDNDGWESSNLDNGRASGSAGSIGSSTAAKLWPLIVGALIAGIVGAVLIVSRKRRQQQEQEDHPLEGGLKKRMKLFSGGAFRRNRGGKLNGALMDKDGAPAFVEISSVRSGVKGGDCDASVKSGRSVRSTRSTKGSNYKPPAEHVMENESEDSED